MLEHHPSFRHRFRVAAIVSTYRGERFIRGCLDDLLAQTLFARGELQIVVINSASPEGEDAIIREYVARHPTSFTYQRTAERETLYAAWNRGVQLATAAYLTNANVDDRHDPRALEIMADALDAHPDVALVYADSYVTDEANALWERAAKRRLLRWPEYSRDTLFDTCYIGQAPMWRRSLHDELGLFDAEMKSAGDYEFWLRLATRHKFLHIPEPLGLYLERPDAISLSNIDLNWRESEIARDRYWNPADGLHPKFRKAQRQFAALREQVRTLPPGARVALYGAGKHTSRMLGMFRQAIAPHAELAGILDDAPRLPAVDGVPVVATSQWATLALAVAIISSDTYEMTMYENLRTKLPDSIAVWRVYHTADRPVGVLA